MGRYAVANLDDIGVLVALAELEARAGRPRRSARRSLGRSRDADVERLAREDGHLAALLRGR